MKDFNCNTELARIITATVNKMINKPDTRGVRYGLCSNVTWSIERLSYLRSCEYTANQLGGLDQLWHECMRHMARWPEGTGSKDYPVPASRGSQCEVEAMDMYDLSDNLYDTSTEYGQLRLELVSWLIDELLNYKIILD